MAREERTVDNLIADNLIATLEHALSKAHHADFFSVVGLLERLIGDDLPRIGSARSPHEELIRFRHDPSLAFSTGDISSASIGRVLDQPNGESLTGQRKIVEITSTFLGLCGSVSPLPPYFSDEVAREDPFAPHKRSFLDIFHHRFLSLFYRCSVRYNLPREFESTAGGVWSKRLLCLTGCEPQDTSNSARPSENDDALPPWQLLGLVPLLATHVRSAHSLELGLNKALRAHLEGISVTVSQFLGGWMKLDDPQCLCLGLRNCELGNSTILGRSVYDAASRIRITIGPLSRESYERFLHGGDLYRLTKNVLSVFSDGIQEYQLELVLPNGVPGMFRLQSTGGNCRLGHNSWLGQRADSETRHYVNSDDDAMAGAA